MNGRALLCVLGLFVVLGGFHYLERRDQLAKIAGLEHQIMLLHADASDTERSAGQAYGSPAAPVGSPERPSERTVHTSVDGSVAANDTPSTVEPEAEAEAETSLEVTELRDGIQNAFVTEGRDPWSSGANHLVTTKVVASLGSNGRLRSVECRSTMCRVETTHASSRQSRQFARRLFILPGERPWNGAIFAAPEAASGDSREPVLAVYYLMREGFSLPSPANVD